MVCALAIVALAGLVSVIAAPNDGSLAALLAASCLALWARGRPRSRAAWLIVAICAILAAAVVVIQPVDHLDNRYGGWLGDR